MEDALLLHVSECPRCLAAAMGHRKPLIEQGCQDLLMLAESLKVPPEQADVLVIGPGHLAQEVLEEYCFDRLLKAEKAAADRHLNNCVDCRTALATQKEFIACLKYALKSWSSPVQMVHTTNISSTAAPKFPADVLLAAREKLPVSRLAGVQALRLLESENVSLGQLERVLQADPVISAHLIRVANSALLSFGQEARNISQAIGRIGLAKTKLHVCGIAVKRMYSSPQLQKIWNHSILAAQLSRQIAGMTQALSPDEASLVALVHDIGHIVLSTLGQHFERARAQRLAKGLLPVQIEEELCGVTHAVIGADLLSDWHFPSDLVDAVRHHHTPSDRVSPLAALLYVAESWLDNQEDVCDLALHQSSTRRLGLTRADLQTLGVKHSPDLELLRFAA